MLRNSIIFSSSAALALLVAGNASALEIDPNQDLRSQLLAAPLTSDLGGDTTVDTYGPRAFRSIAPNASNDQVFDFLFAAKP